MRPTTTVLLAVAIGLSMISWKVNTKHRSVGPAGKPVLATGGLVGMVKPKLDSAFKLKMVIPRNDGGRAYVESGTTVTFELKATKGIGPFKVDFGKGDIRTFTKKEPILFHKKYEESTQYQERVKIADLHSGKNYEVRSRTFFRL